MHLEVVDVSKVNQYATKFAELVTTSIPATRALISVELEAWVDAAVLLAGGVGLLLEVADELLELAHAATASVAAASPATPRISRIPVTSPHNYLVSRGAPTYELVTAPLHELAASRD